MKKIGLNMGWKRRIDDITMEMFAEPGSEISVDLPDDFTIDLHRSPEVPVGANSGFIPGGQAIYTKNFPVPAHWAGKKVLLNMDGAYMNTEVMLNKEQLALHPYGFTPFQVDLTPAMMPGMENRLQIITQVRLPSARWYSGGGLYREVSLFVGEPCRIEPWDLQFITESADPRQAQVTINAEIACDLSGETPAAVSVSMQDPNGAVAASEKRKVTLHNGKNPLSFSLSIQKPLLWDEITPNLYGLTVTVEAEGQEADSITKQVGIRSITMSGRDGMRINGRTIKLRGGCIHHDQTLLGACAYPRAEERKIQLLLDAGFNAVRTAHNPPSEALLDACDKLGMLVLDESFDCWNQGKFAQDYHLYFADWWERDTTYMVLRDRNHPCVFCWSIGNEITESDGTSHADYWTKVQVDLIHRLDPSRPVTLGGMFFPTQPGEDGEKWDNPDLGDRPMGPPPIAPFEKSQKLVEEQMQSAMNMMNTVDVLSMNYSMERYAYMKEHFPDKPVIGSETKSHYAWKNYQAVMENDNVIGDFVWSAYDYLGEAGSGRGLLDPSELKVWLCGDYPWLSGDNGDLDMDGRRRPRSYYRGVLWGLDKGISMFVRHPDHAGKHLYGMGWHWSDAAKTWTFADSCIGKAAEVEAYADCDLVEFYVNGSKVAEAKPVERIARAMIPYAPGVLTCRAWKSGNMVAEDRIETTGAATQIILSPDRSVIHADGMDLSFVTAYVADAEGRPVVTNDYELSATVTGAGRLAGFGSGNPCTPEDYGTGKRFVYRGYALLCLRAQTEPGTIRLDVSCDGLKPASLQITTEQQPV